jgi:iron complex transport system substrate-binding protein
LLTRLGQGNIIGPELGPFPRINPELVVRADPDLIMVGAYSAGDLARRPGWPRMRAVREQRVCSFTAAEIDVLVRPGPRMAEGARLMARCVLDKGAPRRAGGKP